MSEPNTAASRLESTLWDRHANPKSGWTRVPTGAAIVYAVYRRNPRLLLAALLWAAINPFLFAPPETDEAWMTRGVLAERWWVREEGNGTIGLSYPNVCNAGGALAFAYALVAAWRRRPAGAALGTALGSALKLWWIGVLVRRYDALKRVEQTARRR
ncbi:hypothetical protein B4589_015935 (plasmid) [Halolamina sp. CBA1230]|uniref:DUF6653 family protein n=1 Tax=Halolamina sp. CBA1230 TaxID=1853690 RepID=UPI0009A259FC|nr:DUF6653 family protein [Halolamina sp. CBA1230]QKY21903.1 hypothetical protein B4589_015935 [Halolamina sp. CBA1230]